jgi:hypothetical protein
VSSASTLLYYRRGTAKPTLIPGLVVVVVVVVVVVATPCPRSNPFTLFSLF